MRKLAKHHPISSKLYVGNISFNTTEEGLRAAFGQFGNLTGVYLALIARRAAHADSPS